MKGSHYQGRRRIWAGFRGILVCGLLGCAVSSAALEVMAPEASERWTSAYLLMEEGGRLWQTDDFAGAATRYREAAVRFALLQREHPEWRPELVSFRLEYCRLKQSECEAELAKAGTQPEDTDALREHLQTERERTASLERRLADLEARRTRETAALRAELATAQETATMREREASQLRGKLAEVSLAKARLERQETRRAAADGEVEKLRQALATALAERVEQEERAMAAHQEAERLRAEMERQRKALTATSGEWEREFRLRPLTIPQGVSRAAGVRFWTSAAAAPGSGLVEALLAAHWEGRDGSREDAAQWRAAALERGRALLPLWTGLSRTCLAQGEPRMALALAAWGVACAPENVAALTTLGAACLQTGEPQAAERILRQAVALSPTACEAQLCLAALLAQRGEAHRAEGRRWYEAALRGGASRDGVLDTYYGVK